jgi:LuxR family maltose regulon positive regulatory protein
MGVTSDEPAGRPLIAGKLSVPPLRAGVVPRQRLTEPLDEAERLAVVVAPAGWGKTTLVADWARGVAAAGRTAIGWLTLDEADDEPYRFWTYLISAMHVADPALSGDALTALRVTEVNPIDVAVPTLLNDLAGRTGRLTVILDDYHVLTDRRIHEGVEFLLAYLPPHVRLILAGRFDPPLPLAKLRARGELTEIRADGLRFTVDEAGPLVAGVTLMEFEPSQVDELVARTEGWAVGLKLVALALRGSPDPRTGPRGLLGDDRHVMDYLTSEVLDGLQTDQREFLLRTSVLEQLTAALCDAVLGRDDSARIIAELERADLFLVALDPQRSWYRYHRLFRAALRRELQSSEPATVPALLQRAAQWYRSTGDAELAVRCLIAAADFVAAAELLATSDDDFMNQGALGTYLRLAEALPAEVIRAMPRLGISLAAAAGFTGQLERVGPLLDAVEAALTDDTAPPEGWRSARAATATLRTVYVHAGPSIADNLDIARHAVALESDPDRQGWVISRIALGGALSGLDRNDEAAQVLAEAVERATVVGLPAFIQLQATGLLAVTMLKDGQVDGARRLLRTSLPGATAIEGALGDAAAPAVAYLRLAEGLLAHRDGDIDRARTVLAHAASLALATGHPSQIVRTLTARAGAELAGGDRRAASAALSEADEVARSEPVLPAVTRGLDEARERIGRGVVAMARRDGALVEPLTDRELAVLRALQGPLSQREIGVELYLSINTVKGYTKSLYRKLDVASRPEAVRRGRELGII